MGRDGRAVVVSGEVAGAFSQIRRSSAALSTYFRRLLTPPLPGDGLLFVGIVEGVIGWGLSWLFGQYPAVAPFGLVNSIVLLWVVLTAGIVFVGVTYTAPTVRRNRVWVVWGVLNIAATAVNLAAVGGLLPADLVLYAYWHPWFVVLGVGYLATALVNRSSPQVRRRERVVYGVVGVVTLAVLAGSLGPLSAVVRRNVFLIGGALGLAPMAYDVLADAILIARRQ